MQGSGGDPSLQKTPRWTCSVIVCNGSYRPDGNILKNWGRSAASPAALFTLYQLPASEESVNSVLWLRQTLPFSDSWDHTCCWQLGLLLCKRNIDTVCFWDSENKRVLLSMSVRCLASDSYWRGSLSRCGCFWQKIYIWVLLSNRFAVFSMPD